MSKKPGNGAIKGAVIGVLIAVAIPVVLLTVSRVGYKGGGANIGIGLLFAVLPIYLPVMGWLGWKIGKRFS